MMLKKDIDGGDRERERGRERGSYPVLFMLTLLDRDNWDAHNLFKLPPNRNDEMELDSDDVRDPRPIIDVGASIRALIGYGFIAERNTEEEPSSVTASADFGLLHVYESSADGVVALLVNSSFLPSVGVESVDVSMEEELEVV